MRVHLTIQYFFIHILDFSCLKLYWIGTQFLIFLLESFNSDDQ